MEVKIMRTHASMFYGYTAREALCLLATRKQTQAPPSEHKESSQSLMPQSYIKHISAHTTKQKQKNIKILNFFDPHDFENNFQLQPCPSSDLYIVVR
jgi:hypothetical protein